MRRTAALYAESERREALEASLRQSQKMEAVGQLTGGVAHDFNNLLTIILGNLQMALRQHPEGKTRRLMSNAYQAAERAAELTKRLLAFSRSQPLDPRPLDANRLVGGMSDLLDRTLGETIAVETVRSAGLWLFGSSQMAKNQRPKSGSAMSPQAASWWKKRTPLPGRRMPVMLFDDVGMRLSVISPTRR